MLEQYALGHGVGASEDHSRIIRHAYHSSAYTALTQAAYDAWAEIEGETGLQLVLKTGGLDLAVAGTARGRAGQLPAFAGTLRHSLRGSHAAEVRRRWPAWRIGDDVVGLYQQDGGILDIRRATAAHIALARRGRDGVPAAHSGARNLADGARGHPHHRFRPC